MACGLGRIFDFFLAFLLIYPGAAVYLFCCVQRFAAQSGLAAGRFWGRFRKSAHSGLASRRIALRGGDLVKIEIARLWPCQKRGEGGL